MFAPPTTTHAKIRPAVGSRASCVPEEQLGIIVHGSRTSAQLSCTEVPSLQSNKRRERHSQSIAIVGGGVSGIWSALTLAGLGYHNITLIERELRVGGKASAFEHDGRKYPLGAVGTPLALESASFSEEQLFEKPGKFAAKLLGRTGRRLQVLNANNLVLGDATWPVPFPKHELTAQEPVEDWQHAFGAHGRPERFYPNNIDFSKSEELGGSDPVPKRLLPRWGTPQTSWPLVYVSAHGYGVAEARDAPPYYYWARFSQKATNAGGSGPLGFAAPGHNPLGPRGPALRGWDTTSMFEQKLAKAHIQVRTGSAVSAITRAADSVTVRTDDGRVDKYDHLILASDLKASLRFLDATQGERELFSKIRHLPYYTVASFISLPWLATGSVYYLGDHQAPRGGPHDLHASDAGRATAGCPTIMLKANKGSNLTITWAYGGHGVGPAQIEACLHETVLRLGGKFGGVRFFKEWPDYFPHVTQEELRKNFHVHLDAMQGQRRMHMVGEVFNLPLVSECVDWARYIIRRAFA